MSTWNYRVMMTPVSDEDAPHRWGIHEVYYDENGKVISWTEGFCAPRGESFDELKADMGYMLEALTRPSLDYESGKELP